MLQEFVFTDVKNFSFITYGVELVLIVVLYPLVNIILKKRFGDK